VDKRSVPFLIKDLINNLQTATTHKGISSLHRSIFFASIPKKSDLVSPGQTEVIGSGQMTVVRNLNMIAFLAAFAFLAAIVVGVI
jgi:hypothetical protein